ncbi:MAG: hypothetical protein WBA93_11280 [Microcoleaceae cyanobacterium]
MNILSLQIFIYQEHWCWDEWRGRLSFAKVYAAMTKLYSLTVNYLKES